MRDQSTVAIVKIVDGDIPQAMEELLTRLGGLSSLIVPFDQVLLKPNWVTDKDYTTGAVTHPEVIKSCAQQALKAGAKRVIIGDSSYVGQDTKKAIDKSGLESILSRRVEARDFKKSEYMTFAVPNATRYRRLKVPREVMESNVIINLPVMKTHDCLPYTLGLKNMKGVLSDQDKKRLHRWGIEEGMIDLNRLVLPDLTIIDGVIGMEGDGPIEGTPVGLNLLIGSLDPLAAEVVAIHVMGGNPDEIEYIQMAYEAGFGEKNLQKIQIVGSEIDQVQRKFVISQSNQKKLQDTRIAIQDEHACSTCKHALQTFIKENPDLFEEERDFDMILAVGSLVEPSPCSKKKRVAIGNCLREKRDQVDAYIPGCPPFKPDVRAAIQRLVKSEVGQK